jgi:hypothetical protein
VVDPSQVCLQKVRLASTLDSEHEALSPKSLSLES